MAIDVGSFSPIETTAGAWLLTYLVHGTLLFAAVALVTRWRRLRSDALRETLWKFALFGGALTATVQLALGPRLPGGSWTLVAGTEASIDVASSRPALDLLGLEGEESPGTIVGDETTTWLPSSDEAPHRALPRSVEEGAAAGAMAASLPAEMDAVEARSRQRLALGLLLGLPVLLGLVVLVWRWRRFLHAIASRRPLTSKDAFLTLERMRRRAGLRRSVRLTISDAITVPVALGILRPEICVPARAVRELDARALESLLAHELAHHVRRDPLWLAVWRLVEAVLFVQPLNRWARRRWQELAEYRCDAAAAHLVGDGLPLARCLTEVAAWMVEARRSRDATLAPSMAERRSSLERRILRLCASTGRTRPDAHRSWHAGLGAGLLLLAAAAAPGFSADARSSAAEGVESPATSLGDPTSAEMERLPLPEALGALVGELEALDAEVEALRSELRARGEVPEWNDLLDEIAARGRELRARRVGLQESNTNHERSRGGR